MSSSVRTPPPMVIGMKQPSDSAATSCRSASRPSLVASMSRMMSSSTPRRACVVHTASAEPTERVHCAPKPGPLKAMAPRTSTVGMMRLASMGSLVAEAVDAALEGLEGDVDCADHFAERRAEVPMRERAFAGP